MESYILPRFLEISTQHHGYLDRQSLGEVVEQHVARTDVERHAAAAAVRRRADDADVGDAAEVDEHVVAAEQVRLAERHKRRALTAERHVLRTEVTHHRAPAFRGARHQRGNDARPDINGFWATGVGDGWTDGRIDRAQHCLMSLPYIGLGGSAQKIKIRLNNSSV